MEKESSTEFCGILIIFHEVMKLDRVFNLTYVASFPQMQLTSFFYLGFLSRPFPNHRGRVQGKRKDISLTSYHTTSSRFTGTLDVSQAIAAESSPLHIGRSQSRTGNH